jgi:hypothetical protein
MSNQTRWVSDRRARGGRLLVETLDPTPNVGKQKAKRAEAFAQISLTWAAEMAEGLQAPRAMLLIVLAYLAWKHKNMTFPVSNEIAQRYGISRYTKYRGLALLGRAGKIKVTQQNGRAPIVTLLRVPGKIV